MRNLSACVVFLLSVAVLCCTIGSILSTCRESLCLSLDSPSSHHPPIGYLHSQLKGEREQLQQQLRYLVQQNQNLDRSY
uniref:Uncharacterized protein n=1 Tax=Anguilla anguilla TaxID=7936 RepID=A0A0E9V5H0_ANGAN